LEHEFDTFIKLEAASCSDNFKSELFGYAFVIDGTIDIFEHKIGNEANNIEIHVSRIIIPLWHVIRIFNRELIVAMVELSLREVFLFKVYVTPINCVVKSVQQGLTVIFLVVGVHFGHVCKFIKSHDCA